MRPRFARNSFIVGGTGGLQTSEFQCHEYFFYENSPAAQAVVIWGERHRRNAPQAHLLSRAIVRLSQKFVKMKSFSQSPKAHAASIQCPNSGNEPAQDCRLQFSDFQAKPDRDSAVQSKTTNLKSII
jgi:hypothetical protein